jgi:HK97 family phage portal protein
MRGIIGAIAGRSENKTTDIFDYTWQALFGGPGSKAGVGVNVASALRVTTVLSCARVLAEGIATPPLKILRESADGSKAPATDHTVYKLLSRQPNEWMTSFEMREMMMFHAVLTGNAYAYIGRIGTEIRELIPLLPERVVVRQETDYTLTYEVSDLNGVIAKLPRQSVMHIRGPSWNGYAGLDMVRQAREAIGLAIATEESHARLHSNGVRPGGLISVEGTLGDDARKRLKASLEADRAGVQNAFKTMVLDQNAKWTPFSMTGVDSQHLATRAFEIEEICRALRVFPQMVGYTDKTATFASAEAFFLAHVIHSLMPWVTRWEHAIERDLLPGEDDIIAKFLMQGMLRGDNTARANFYGKGILDGWLTRNEARALEDLNPLAGLDDPLAPLNMTTTAGRGVQDAPLPPGQKPPTDSPDAGDQAKMLAEIGKLIAANGGDPTGLETKIGRILSASNESRIRTARGELDTVLATLGDANGPA